MRWREHCHAALLLVHPALGNYLRPCMILVFEPKYKNFLFANPNEVRVHCLKNKSKKHLIQDRENLEFFIYVLHEKQRSGWIFFH